MKSLSSGCVMSLETAAKRLLVDCDLVAIGEHEKTPQRFVNLMENLLCKHTTEQPELTTFSSENNEMIITEPIDFFSLCPHHIALILGKAYVGYIPAGKVLGLSKIPRLVRWMAGTMVKQEDLTCQIANELEKVLFSDDQLRRHHAGGGYSIDLGPRSNGVAEVLRAIHTCCLVRGIRVNSDFRVQTSKMTGAFLASDRGARQEFLSLIRRGNGE